MDSSPDLPAPRHGGGHHNSCLWCAPASIDASNENLSRASELFDLRQVARACSLAVSSHSLAFAGLCTFTSERPYCEPVNQEVDQRTHLAMLFQLPQHDAS